MTDALAPRQVFQREHVGLLGPARPLDFQFLHLVGTESGQLVLFIRVGVEVIQLPRAAAVGADQLPMPVYDGT